MLLQYMCINIYLHWVHLDLMIANLIHLSISVHSTLILLFGISLFKWTAIHLTNTSQALRSIIIQFLKDFYFYLFMRGTQRTVMELTQNLGEETEAVRKLKEDEKATWCLQSFQCSFHPTKHVYSAPTSSRKCAMIQRWTKQGTRLKKCTQ